jgi:hypothetical protein
MPVTSERTIASQWSVSRSAVHRHKARHLKPAVARAIATRTELSAAAIVQRLVDLIQRFDRALEKAEADGDLRALASLGREFRETIVTIGRTMGLWTDRPSIIVDQRRQTLNLAVGELSDDQLRAAVQRMAALEANPDELSPGACA